MARAGTTFWDTAQEVLSGVTEVVGGVQEVVSAFGDGGDNPGATQMQITGAVTTSTQEAARETKKLPFSVPLDFQVSPTTIFLIGGAILVLLVVAKKVV